MANRISASKIWAAPKKINALATERKISWVELFYDLVYVIAISKITSAFSTNFSFSGFLDYFYMFSIIFWGWLNGSLYHDFVGNAGLRSRFIILWQILLVAALIVTLSSPPAKLLFNATIALAALQLYITYMWASLSYYDKTRKSFNNPYVICYTLALLFELSTLFFHQNGTERTILFRALFYISLLFNFIPALFFNRILNERTETINLSSSMSERLGLITTIVFGEVVLNVINGISIINSMSWEVWILFTLGIIITFILWWIFFDITAGRETKAGFLNATWIELSYMITLMALGFVAAIFLQMFTERHNSNLKLLSNIQKYFSVSIAFFLIGINCISYFLKYDMLNVKVTRNIKLINFIVAIIICLVPFIFTHLSVSLYLSILFVCVLLVVIYIIKNWVIAEEIKAEK